MSSPREHAPHVPAETGCSENSAPTSGRALSPRRKAAGRKAASTLRSLNAITSQRQMAESIGVSSSQVDRWADPNDGAQITVRDTYLLPKAARRALYMALLAQVDDDDGAERDTVSPIATVMIAMCRCGETVAEGTAACADQEVDARESVQLEGSLMRLATESVKCACRLSRARRSEH